MSNKTLALVEKRLNSRLKNTDPGQQVQLMKKVNAYRRDQNDHIRNSARSYQSTNLGTCYRLTVRSVGAVTWREIDMAIETHTA